MRSEEGEPEINAHAIRRSHIDFVHTQHPHDATQLRELMFWQILSWIGAATLRGLQASKGEEAGNLLPSFPRGHTVHYIVTEDEANDALMHVRTGPVGFDTEYTKRRPTPEEAIIIKTFPPSSAARKYAMLGWQIIELQTVEPFPVAWNNIGVRLIQLARGDDAWVLDMWKIKAFPLELRRILLSPEIIKTGVGLNSDVLVLWEDLRTEAMALVDGGLMAKLLLAEKYPKAAYGNLSLKTSVEEVLGFTMNKSLADSNWSAEELSEEQKEYAALDAVASLRLYDKLKEALPKRSVEIDADIPAAWYTFNTKRGEQTRVKRAADGSEIPWKLSDCTWYSGGKFQGYP
ncbi:ribonuclease H-like domain-containing protein [Mycena vitilis]|nr:ribonuclease H-like domain-containing protein [Mycena vitilis]